MKRIRKVVFSGIGLSALVFAVVWVYFNNAITHPAAVTLPDRVAGVQRTAYKPAGMAVPDFANLHGSQFPVASGAMGIYGNGRIMLWAAGAPFNFMNSRMVAAMQTWFAQGSSTLTPIGRLSRGSRTIYTLEGMGQRYFLFQSKDLVIWLASEPALAERALQQILPLYP